MKKIRSYNSLIILFIILFSACKNEETLLFVNSPDNNIKIEFSLTKTGQPIYLLKHKNKTNMLACSPATTELCLTRSAWLVLSHIPLSASHS